ncbi:hypothetical protein AAY473_014545 [Plecturocebus cupreus]
MECSGMTVVHYSFELLSSSNPPASASLMSSCYVAQAGLKLLASQDPPNSAFQIAGITDVNLHTGLRCKDILQDFIILADFLNPLQDLKSCCVTQAKCSGMISARCNLRHPMLKRF